MQSMIKRKVDISFTAHVETIVQVVSDAYILNKERDAHKNLRDTAARCGNMVYYRMLRQTGHTAALKKLLSPEFQKENDAYVYAVFHTMREHDLFLPEQNVKKTTIASFPASDIHVANIIVFSDTLHDPKRLAAAQDMIQNNPALFPNLALVVFLG